MKLTKKETNYPHIEILNVRDSTSLKWNREFLSNYIVLKKEFP